VKDGEENMRAGTSTWDNEWSILDGQAAR
jgi:hypothetical protein